MSTQYLIAFRTVMKSYPLHSLLNAPSIFASATRSQRDEEWQKLGAADMWRSTSRSAVDRCEESPSELSPGFARHNIKIRTKLLMNFKMRNSVIERRGLKILHFLWKLKHWMILSDVVFTEDVLFYLMTAFIYCHVCLRSWRPPFWRFVSLYLHHYQVDS